MLNDSQKKPDVILHRAALIGLHMDVLRDPDETLSSALDPEKYEQWAKTFYAQIIKKTAQRIGIAPEILADKEKRTEAQTNEISLTAYQEQIARLEMFLGSNYVAATNHLTTYCAQRAEEQNGENIYKPLDEEIPNDDILTGELVNVPLTTSLYFFATHTEIDYRGQDTLTDDNKAELVRLFDSLDAFYKKHRTNIKSGQALLSAYLDSLNPKDPAAKNETLAQVHQIRKATAFTLNNGKAFNKLIGVFPEGETSGQLQIRVFTDPKTKQDVITYMALSYEGDDNIVLKGRRAITGFDKAVYNTVSTLYAAGNRQFSAQDVYRTMNGNTKNSPSKAQLNRIINSLDKMIYTALHMDVTAEMTNGGLTLDDERIVKGVIKSPMLQATTVTAQTENGRTVTVYRLSAEPILYTYCKSKRQIITVPIALLDTSEATSSTATITAIREYLLQQIELMRGGFRNNATIRYSTIYEETDTPAPENRKDAGRMRDQIKAVLDVWTARGYIKGYTDAKEGRSVTGITILYDPVVKNQPVKESTRKPRKR